MTSKRKPSKIQARYLLWQRGNLNYMLWPAQKKIEAKFKEVKERGGKLFFVNCSRRIGKTHWVAKKCIETAISCKNNKPRIKIGTAYYEDLKEFIIPAHNAVLDHAHEDFRPKYVSSNKKYVFRQKESEIKMVGLDLKPNGLRGTYADLIVLEECGFIRRLDYLYSAICVPMTMYRKGAMVVMIGTPPETPDHPFVQFMEKAKQEDAYIELTIDDNDRLTPEEKQGYLDECLTETDKLREYYCKCVVDESRAIVPEWKDAYAREYPKDEFYQFYQSYEGMDLGVVDKTINLYAYYDYKNATLVVEGELSMNGHEMTTDKLAARIKMDEDKYFPGKPIYKRTADNDNLLLLNDLTTKHQLPFIPIRKGALEAMVNKTRIWVKSGRIIVNPRCKQLIGCLSTGIWNTARSGFDRSALYGHYDAIAALIYLVWSIDENYNPVPALYNISRDTHHYRDSFAKREGGNIQVIKQVFNRQK